MEAIAILDIAVNGQILFDRPNSMIVARITEVREKAVKVDYAVDSISFTNFLSIYTHACWIPISVIISDGDAHCHGLTVKKWFAQKFEGGHRIKSYFLNEKGVPCHV